MCRIAKGYRQEEDLKRHRATDSPTFLARTSIIYFFLLDLTINGVRTGENGYTCTVDKREHNFAVVRKA